MHLNPDQKLALDEGLPVPLIVENKQCVLILKDAYEQVQDEVEETYAAVEEVLNEEDDPGLEAYQQYKR